MVRRGTCMHFDLRVCVKNCWKAAHVKLQSIHFVEYPYNQASLSLTLLSLDLKEPSEPWLLDRDLNFAFLCIWLEWSCLASLCLNGFFIPVRIWVLSIWPPNRDSGWSGKPSEFWAVTPRSGFEFSFLMLLMGMIMFNIPMLESLLLSLSEYGFSRCDLPIVTAGDPEI